MSKISKGQAAVLRRLAMGDVIINDGGRFVYSTVIPAATIRSLRDKGLIYGDSPHYDASYRITPAGRAIVQAADTAEEG